MELKRKVAVISGGASGLGLATARVLVAQGMKVGLFDLNEKEGKKIVSDFGEDLVKFVQVDVTRADSVVAGIEALVSKFGTFHLCVNCAGVAPAKKVLSRDSEAMPLEDFAKTININLVGTFNLARLAAEQMAKNEPEGEAGERGVIINTASAAAYDGQIGQSAYAASKGGIVSLTLPMARDLAPLGIRVNTIAPGIMGTPMLLAMPEKVQESLVGNIQFPKRMGLPEEYGKLVVHVSENAYLNAETIRLDGALRMPPR